MQLQSSSNTINAPIEHIHRPKHIHNNRQTPPFVSSHRNSLTIVRTHERPSEWAPTHWLHQFVQVFAKRLPSEQKIQHDYLRMSCDSNDPHSVYFSFYFISVCFQWEINIIPVYGLVSTRCSHVLVGSMPSMCAQKTMAERERGAQRQYNKTPHQNIEFTILQTQALEHTTIWSLMNDRILYDHLYHQPLAHTEAPPLASNQLCLCESVFKILAQTSYRRISLFKHTHSTKTY